MGLYDTFIDGEKQCQCKAWKRRGLRNIRVGEKTPLKRSLIIVFPSWGADAKFALIKNGVFIELTDDESKTYPPYISKWGKSLKHPWLEE